MIEKNIKKIIKKAFIDNNTSGAAIARKVKRHRVTVYDVISGKSRSKKIRQAISDSIGIPVNELWLDQNQKGENNA